jgi:hypothetical protein
MHSVNGPFFFSECTISAIVYLDMMELYAAPQKSSPTGRRTATLGITCSSVLGCNVSKPMDWE